MVFIAKNKQYCTWILYFIMFFLSWYCVTYWRTSSFGMSVSGFMEQLYMLAISIIPIALIGVLVLKLIRHQLQIKIYFKHVLIIAILVVIASESWASTEEYLFKRKANLDMYSDVYEGRWVPFDNNHLGYSPQTGFYAGD